jgi:hypothetical protein
MISISLENFDRIESVAVFRALANDESVRIKVDFANRTIEDIGWGEGNKFVREPAGRPKPKKAKRTSAWKLAGQFVRAATNPALVGTYLRAVGSRAWLGPVPLAVLDFRHQCCHGTTMDGVRVSEPCRHRHETERGVFCKSCGCAEWKQADIRVDPDNVEAAKLACPDLDCPKGRWTAITVFETELIGA